MNAVLLAAVAVTFVSIGDTWWQLFTALFAALVLISRNVTGGRWIDFTLGGLNHQIEHHLLPSMPRPNLRRAQPLVRDFCAQYGVSSSQCGLLTSYADVLRHLHDAGAPLREEARTRRRAAIGPR